MHLVYHHAALLAPISLPVGLLDYIMCLYRADV